MAHVMALYTAIGGVTTKPPSLKFDEIKNIKSEYSNWVVPKRIMTGPSPIAVPPEHVNKNIMDIIDDGIDTFVCLQTESTPDDYKKLIPHDVLVNKNIKFIHYPIIDTRVPSKLEFVKSITELLNLIAQGRSLYIHCMGGHGRTGLYMVALLACIYKELRNKESAMHYAQSTHDMRRKQTMHFYGILPARIAENKCQQELLDDFFTLLTFL